MASEILRVTQVLSLFSNMWKIPEEVLARKARVGTELHDAMFRYFFGPNEDRMENIAATSETINYLYSIHEWATGKKFSIKLFEERLTDEVLGFTGKPDAVFEIDGVSYLFDWKTSAKEDPVGWRLQGTAYVELLRRSGHEVSDTFYFLKLRKDGKRADTFAYKYTYEGWITFLKAMDCARYHLKWKGELPDAE